MDTIKFPTPIALETNAVTGSHLFCQNLILVCTNESVYGINGIICRCLLLNPYSRVLVTGGGGGAS